MTTRPTTDAARGFGAFPLAQQQLERPDSPSVIEGEDSLPHCAESAAIEAGRRLHDAVMGCTVSDAEILDHVANCARLRDEAAARWDFAASDEWEDRRLQAVAALPAEVRP